MSESKSLQPSEQRQWKTRFLKLYSLSRVKKKTDLFKESVHTDWFSEYARYMTCNLGNAADYHYVSDTVII